MKNSILQKLIKWTEEIEKVSLGEGITNLDELGSEMFERALSIAMDVLRESVERLNQNSRSQKSVRKASGIVIKEKDVERTILLKIGSFTYKRDYCYDKQAKKHFYPIDEIIGVEKYSRISDNVSAELVNKATEFSYAKSSELVSGGKVSRQTVRNSILKLEVPEKEVVEKKAVKELHIYADEDHVHMQRPNKKKGKKNQIVPVVTVTEGTETVSKGRNRTINPVHFVDEEFNSKRLWASVDGYISQAYVDENPISISIYIHGDGGRWINKGLEERGKVTRVMDGYHFGKRTREISRLFPKSNIGMQIKKLIREGDQRRLDLILQELMSEADTHEKCEKVREYAAYVMSYYEEIRNRLSLAVPGSCTEGLVSHILSERFSRNPMGWSKEGLGKLSKARVYVKNGCQIKGADFREKESKRYSTYVEETRKSLMEGRYDWQLDHPERYIFNGNSGTQKAIRYLGKCELIS